MTVAIVSTFGALENYKDKAMVQRTLIAFLESLRRQTSDDWMLFMAANERPDYAGDNPREVWKNIKSEAKRVYVPDQLPKHPSDKITYSSRVWDGAITDMGRKTWAAVIMAGQWAWGKKLPGFWMLRMDSDDLLARDHVHRLNSVDTRRVRAVYNRKCYMVDPRLQELAIHTSPYATTCNAVWFEFTDGNDGITPEWFYLARDHTLFNGQVRRDKIKHFEWDWSLCITTNSGNSISGRPELSKELNVRKMPFNKAVRESFGLDAFIKGV